MDTSHYVYHPNHEAVIVSGADYERYLREGWFDSPAKFPQKVAETNAITPDGGSIAPEIKKKGRPPKAKAEAVHVSVTV